MTAAGGDHGQRQKLGLVQATVIGIASMVGAGIFTVWAPAIVAAGSWLPLALLLAALVAWCNASSTAQLAAQYPSAGGTYIYGREQLGPWPGYVAGWCFVIGKMASVAAMAMALAAYLVPQQWQRVVAIALLWVLIGINLRGITRTAAAAKVLVSLALLSIVTALVVGWNAGPIAQRGTESFAGSAYGVLQAAGLLFFAFAGYARVATMGEEVRDPQRTIRLAILSALTIVVVLYAAVALSLLMLLGSATLAASLAPLMVLAGENLAARSVVVVGAAAAVAGALLALLSGIGRTGLAMARTGDLPRWFAATDEATHVPYRVELTVGVVLTVVLLAADVRTAIGFSSFGVLIYYLIANLAAWTQDARHRRYSKAWQGLGAALCVLFIVTVPWQSVLGGLVVVLVGIFWRIFGVKALR